MKLTFLILLLLTIGFISHSQVTKDKTCRTNVELDVALDTIYWARDSVKKEKREHSSVIVDYGAGCNPCWILKSLNEKYRVVSFTLTTKSEEDIYEIPVLGNTITGMALVQFRIAKKGETIFFECVRALHENGNIYTLKPFSIIR